MDLPYQAVPRFYIERIVIAVMCNESMDLHWHDQASQQSYMARVWPQDVTEENGAEWLVARNEAGEAVRIRLDLIRNFPTPVK
ncbi:hypothetical protein ACFDAU_02215 [Sulfuriferula sp. GW1]|uniref:hypothetical protein n=1 Tax=Sulfuriferula sp. GW1 TaxID=3345111 RepID=UPI0039AFD9FC